MKKYIPLICSSLLVVACNGGGGGGNSDPYANINPNPNPSPMTYPAMPSGFASALPTFTLPQTAAHGLQIAWGYNDNPAAPNLVAYVNQTTTGSWSGGYSICTATPVASDGQGGTWLVGAAHCYLSKKTNFVSVLESNILLTDNIRILKGVNSSNQQLIANSATVFVQQDYCKGATFSSLGKCPNFGPNEGAVGGQGNDIALIHINAKFNESESYPQLAKAESYPKTYTMAPVLSMGYGDNNTIGGNGTLFYVVNYQYQQSDSTGYHYLYNSYFNPSPANFGYSALVCGGDSGGPDLFWNGSNWLLLSEHTYGPTDACGTFYNYLPNGATNVSSYYSWLTGIISDTNRIADCKSGVIANCVTNGS